MFILPRSRCLTITCKTSIDKIKHDLDRRTRSQAKVMKIEQLDISGKLYCIKLTAVLAGVNLYMTCVTSNRRT